MKDTITRCLVGALIASFVGVLGAQELGPGARPIGADWSRSPVMAATGMAATAGIVSATGFIFLDVSAATSLTLVLATGALSNASNFCFATWITW